ncbi:unnamed protein product [marine sediment metagenome]|uniref:PhoU domain-containing protein n=1 Tax=marine sediment metagenome TaxID=412755 RepID=X1L6W3_9ZZZZ
MFHEFLNIWRKKDLTFETLNESIEMLREDQEMFLEAVRSLRESDNGILRIDIYKKDKEVNKSERDIRKKVLTHLMLFDKTEITSGLVFASIVIDIERIGDYTKNIADLAILHKKKLIAGSFDNQVASIENRVKGFFDITIKAFPESNAELARKVLSEYKTLSYDCTMIKESLIKKENKLNGSEAVTLALYLRFLKRVAAHLFNICSSVVNPFHRIGYKEKKK